MFLSSKREVHITLLRKKKVKTFKFDLLASWKTMVPYKGLVEQSFQKSGAECVHVKDEC